MEALDFTKEECMLIFLYNPGTLKGLKEELIHMKSFLTREEEELLHLTDSVLCKLQQISEEAFEKLTEHIYG